MNPALNPARYHGLRVSLVRIRPEGYVHARAFDEIDLALGAALAGLGAQVTRRDNQIAAGELNLLLGAHLLDAQALAGLPPEAVAYNLEQVCAGSMLPEARLAAYRGRIVWDYSQKNLLAWPRHGAEAVHVPLGYDPALSIIPKSDTQDIDVLFYGSMNDRRRVVLDALRAAGLAVHTAFGVYGDERDALIARARVVLNIHAYAAQIFEMARVSYLLANAKAVVAELGDETEIPTVIRHGVELAPYDGLVEACGALVADAARRQRLAAAGQAAMQALPYAEILATALPQTLYLLARRGIDLGPRPA